MFSNKSLSYRLTVLTVILTLILVLFIYIDVRYVLAGSIIVFFVGIILYDRFQKKHSILRNYPLIGRIRYLSELIRPEIRQYFIESDIDGKPFNRRQRSLVYQRSKNVKDSISFGTQLNSKEPGYEWVEHSIFPVKVNYEDLRVIVGDSACKQPYSSSLLNIGAMSFGALSSKAIDSLGQGARMGSFALNTGEGGISQYHLFSGADLIWQIGTGYFGCRDQNGSFSCEQFILKAAHHKVKMIEIKLSQGAKPGRGGLLPAVKNTPEIAAIRGVTPYKDIISPAYHTAFTDVYELLDFISKLKELSNGKPIGIKLCVGSVKEIDELFRAIENTGLYPDFITVDGGEGGTGAAPLEFSDHIGAPLYDGLVIVSKQVKKYGLKEKIKIIAAGKIISGFDLLKVIALGADLCYSARGMMMSLGCIQALQCDSGKCPVGIATQEKFLTKGIVVQDKRIRIKNYHENTLKATAEIMGACGFKTLSDVDPKKFKVKLNNAKVKSLDDIFFKENDQLTNLLFEVN